MQTSGNGSSSTTRVAGMAAAIGLAIAVTGNWIACTPGDVNCDNVDCPGGNTGTGGGGEGGTGGGAPITIEPPAGCGPLMVTNVDEFETKFIAPRCGQRMCHGPSAVFPPKMLDIVEMIRPTLVGKNGQLACKTDFYINKSAWMKSFVLAKISAEGDTLPCPSAPTGKADAGGTRMPNKEGAAGTPGPRLMDGEIECFSWYIQSVATAK
jgi:hypothetical protein